MKNNTFNFDDLTKKIDKKIEKLEKLEKKEKRYKDIEKIINKMLKAKDLKKIYDKDPEAFNANLLKIIRTFESIKNSKGENAEFELEGSFLGFNMDIVNEKIKDPAAA